MGAVAVRGGSADADLLTAYKDGQSLATAIPTVALGTGLSGNLMLAIQPYQTDFYGGILIFRQMMSAERSHLVDYFYGATA